MNNLAKRILFGTTLGGIFGLLCFMGFSSNPNIDPSMASMTKWSFQNPMMWTIIANRIVLGFIVGIVGLITIHPFFGFKIPAFLRGAKFGAMISLLMSTGVLLGENVQGAWEAFWLIIGAGAVIGAIIDTILTKLFGQGIEIIKK